MSLNGIERLPEMTSAEIAADIAKTRMGTAMLKVVGIIVGLFVLSLIISQVAKASTGGDCDGDGRITMGDPVWLINYIFAGGPAPVACECPQSFFLFDNQILQAVETYYVDQDWEEAYIGGRTFVKGGPVRRVYSIGPDSQPSWFLMVPDTVVWEIADTIGSSMMSYSVAPIPVDTEPVWTNGAVYSQPDLEAMSKVQYSRTDTLPVVEERDSLTFLWRDNWYSAWVEGEITYREYLDLRLKGSDIVVRVHSNIPKGVVIDSVIVKAQDWEKYESQIIK